jgi:hypothetical protein
VRVFLSALEDECRGGADGVGEESGGHDVSDVALAVEGDDVGVGEGGCQIGEALAEMRWAGVAFDEGGGEVEGAVAGDADAESVDGVGVGELGGGVDGEDGARGGGGEEGFDLLGGHLDDVAQVDLDGLGGIAGGEGCAGALLTGAADGGAGGERGFVEEHGGEGGGETQGGFEGGDGTGGMADEEDGGVEEVGDGEDVCGLDGHGVVGGDRGAGDVDAAADADDAEVVGEESSDAVPGGGVVAAGVDDEKGGAAAVVERGDGCAGAGDGGAKLGHGGSLAPSEARGPRRGWGAVVEILTGVTMDGERRDTVEGASGMGQRGFDGLRE